MGVVSPDVGVVRPGVGVVRTDVEASGEEDVDRWDPISFSNGEDLKCPPSSVLLEDLKWPLSTVQDRKFPTSAEKKERRDEQEEQTPMVTPVIVNHDSIPHCHNPTEDGANHNQANYVLPDREINWKTRLSKDADAFFIILNQ